MKDIENKEDIELLMRTFYAKAIPDDVIGHYFTKVIQMNLDEHLPVITDFWETVLFGTAKYRSNAVEVHQQLHAKSAFTDVHFERWVNLFRSAVDQLFSGDKAEQAKQRALSIATVMKIKTNHGSSPINIQK